MISRTTYRIPKSRHYIPGWLKNLSQMRLSVINDYVPLQRRPFIGFDWYRLIDCSFGKRRMIDRVIYVQIIVFSYGFQVWGRA